MKNFQVLAVALLPLLMISEISKATDEAALKKSEAVRLSSRHNIFPSLDLRKIREEYQQRQNLLKLPNRINDNGQKSKRENYYYYYHVLDPSGSKGKLALRKQYYDFFQV